MQTRWRHRVPLSWHNRLAPKKVRSFMVQFITGGRVRLLHFSRRMSSVGWLEMGDQQTNTQSGITVLNVFGPCGPVHSSGTINTTCGDSCYELINYVHTTAQAQSEFSQCNHPIARIIFAPQHNYLY